LTASNNSGSKTVEQCLTTHFVTENGQEDIFKCYPCSQVWTRQPAKTDSFS